MDISHLNVSCMRTEMAFCSLLYPQHLQLLVHGGLLGQEAFTQNAWEGLAFGCPSPLLLSQPHCACCLGHCF